MPRYNSLFLIISLTGFLLASCTTVPEQRALEQETVVPVAWSEQQQKRQLIDNWELRGRIGVQTADDGGSLDLIWKQAVGDFSIHLIAPFGAGNYRIRGDDTSAVIYFPDGRKISVADVEDIFSTALKIDLPLSAVKDWVRGLPARSMPVKDMRWNNQGLLSTVRQSGWNVEMEKYTGSKILMPHVINLSRDDDEDLEIRLALRQWMVDN